MRQLGNQLKKMKVDGEKEIQANRNTMWKEIINKRRNGLPHKIKKSQDAKFLNLQIVMCVDLSALETFLKRG